MALKKEYWVIGILSIMVVAFVLIIVIATIATRELRTAPPAITGLIATDASYIRHGQIDISWSPSDATDFLYYYIYASQEEITDVVDLFPIARINDRTDVSYQATRYRVPGLSLALFAFMKDTQYWFAVTAVDFDGKESMVSNSVSTTIEIMPPPSPAPSVIIKAVHMGAFNPETITVPVGTTIAWTNIEDSYFEDCYFFRNPHTVVSTTGLFNYELTDTDNIFSYTFNQTGVFTYHCELHPEETATVIVVEELEAVLRGQ